LIVNAMGEPLQVAVLPGNSRLPFLLAVVTSTAFLAPLVGAYVVSLVALVGVAVVALIWAWSLGSKTDEGLVDAGHGIALPSAWEVPDPPGWWGSLLLLVADAVHFGSLLFGYAFLWTIAPNWPPKSFLMPGLAEPTLAAFGALALVAGPRLAARGIQSGRRPWFGITLAGFGVLALTGAASTILLARSNPAGHAYDATLWLLAGHIGLHTLISGIMLGYLAARVWAGYASPQRIGEMRIVQLWADFTALTGLIALGAAWLPGTLT
jgi:cytochrome c oxidase subunit I+III